MRTSAKLVLAALTAAVVLASSVGTASARSLSTSESAYSIPWTSLEFTTEVATARCRLTLEGSFHSRTLAKTARILVGAISRAVIGHPCTGGEGWFDNGIETEPLGTAPNRLPYHQTYEFFTGTLPTISTLGILLSRFSFVIQATVLGVSARCRYGNGTDNITLNANREGSGGLTSISLAAGRARASLVEVLLNGGLCPASMSLAGTSGALTAPPPRTITITLI